MFDTQADLLSFSQLHSDVDQLFRAYLDTALMEKAGDCLGDSRKYWHAVMDLRDKKLGYREPPTTTASPDATADKMTVANLIDEMPLNAASSSQDATAEGLQYLYWFEVRADYWSRVTSENLEKLIKTLPASERLELLCNQARILEIRLGKKPSPTEDESTEDESSGLRGIVWVDPPSAEGLKGLLAKMDGPPESPPPKKS